jgi:hypothetical protein
MSYDLLLGITVAAGMLLACLFVAAFAAGSWRWGLGWLIVTAIFLATMVPMTLEAEDNQNAARDRKQQETCANYGGVGTEFGDETGSGRTRVYHRLYMCKKGPRVIYEW